jgi:hypothetical protein
MGFFLATPILNMREWQAMLNQFKHYLHLTNMNIGILAFASM